MAIVDNAFREWIADFKATNPCVADSRAIIDTAQYAFAAGRKAQREIDAARQPVGEAIGEIVYSGEGGLQIEFYDGKPLAPMKLYAAPPAQAVDLGDFKALYRAYVRLLESGRDRIRDLGGTCDPVDVMEANDVDLQAARRVIDSQVVGK